MFQFKEKGIKILTTRSNRCILNTETISYKKEDEEGEVIYGVPSC